MKKNLTYLLLIFFFDIFCQNKFTKEFSLQSDNDLYASIKKDRYYTNGIFLSYKYLNKSRAKNQPKRLYEIQIGQQLFTPKKANVRHISEHDRPFAGYLYTSFGLSIFNTNESVFKISTQVGVIGTYALGKETMAWVHKLYGFELATGWKHQISNTLTANINTSYIKNINKLSSKNISTEWINSLNIGTIWNNISSGVNLRIGFTPLKNTNNSLAYQGNLSYEKTKKKEFFFHIKPTINYILYDATIQGSFFNNTSPVTYDIKPIVFTTEIGISYAIKRINLGYKLNFHTKKLKSNPVPKINKYGTININYLFN